MATNSSQPAPRLHVAPDSPRPGRGVIPKLSGDIRSLIPVLGITFLYPQGGTFGFEWAPLLWTVAMCAAFVGLVPPQHQLVRVTAVLYAVTAAMTFVVPNPLGSNIVRLGMYAAGWLADLPAFKWIGAGLAAAGVVAYLALATAFGGEAFRLIGALGIIALGLALTVGGLAQRLARKSPPPSVPPSAPVS